MPETTVEFTQFMLPDGRREPTVITLPDPDGELDRAVCDIQDKGAVFECECLRVGNLISLTITDPEMGDLFSELVENGPEVPVAVERMIRRAHAELEAGNWPEMDY